jgi:hypothetical protein
VLIRVFFFVSFRGSVLVALEVNPRNNTKQRHELTRTAVGDMITAKGLKNEAKVFGVGLFVHYQRPRLTAAILGFYDLSPA